MDLFLTQLHGPEAQRIPLDQLPHYDHIFDYDNGHFIELDNSDTLETIQFHRLKTARSPVFGEVMTIGTPAAAQYFVKGILVTDPKADGYWTLDRSMLQFRLSSLQHHFLWEHFYLPTETLRQTGPLIVDFYVNRRLLDRVRFPKDGEVVYQHEVPIEWLKPDGITTVEMRVANPYIAPKDGTRLGVLLRSAAFTAGGPS
jgi:hypothetical protein